MLHWKVDPVSLEVKVKSGLTSFDGSAGLLVMVVSGAVLSTLIAAESAEKALLRLPAALVSEAWTR